MDGGTVFMLWYLRKMNSFKHQYMIVHLDDEFYPLLEKALKPYNKYDQGKTDQWNGKEYTSEDHPDRSSQVCWVDDSNVYELMDGLVAFANSKCEWNLDVNFMEPFQLTKYETGDFYDWHIDESNWSIGKRPENRIRKISFTILLNDEFEGGEFILYTSEKKEIPLKKKDIILFHADTPHKVNPITSGVRKSLVGWVQGPPFK